MAGRVDHRGQFRRVLRGLLPALAFALLALAATGSSARGLAAGVEDSPAATQPFRGVDRRADVLRGYGLPSAPYRGKVVALAPMAADAYLELVDPTGGTYCNACLVDASVDPNAFVLEMWLQKGSDGDVTGQQSYMTFDSSKVKVVVADDLANCQLTTRVKPDLIHFDTPLQNEVCNYGPECTGQITTLPGLMAFASGAFLNPPQAPPFRVAQIGLCAIADGTSVLAWQFADGPIPLGCPGGTAPTNRNTRITSWTQGVVIDCSMFNNYMLTFVNVPSGYPLATYTNTPTVTFTRTRPSTGTRTPTRTGTPSRTPTKTGTPTPTPVESYTPTLTNTPTRTITATRTTTSTITPGVCVTTDYPGTGLPRSIGPNIGTVTTSTLVVPEVFNVTTIEVIGLDIAHTFPGDLDVTLISPRGTRVELFTDVCSREDWTSANTGFDLAASKGSPMGSVCPPSQAQYRPEGALEAFVGQLASGTWILEVTDDANLDAGMLNGWTLRLGGGLCPALTPVPSLTPALTNTRTATRTTTPTVDLTITFTPSSTRTSTFTDTPTPTATRTLTFTSTPSRTPTPTRTNTPTNTATATPVPLLVGHVMWEGYPPPDGAQPDPLQAQPFTLTLKSAALEVNYPFMYTDASGVFTVDLSTLPEGIYTYRIKGHPPNPVGSPGPSWLAGAGTITINHKAGSLLYQEMGLMRGGDADNSNLTTGTGVDIADFNILKSSFGKGPTDPGYDNRANSAQDMGPAVVDVSDFNTLRRNFGQPAPGPIGPQGAGGVESQVTGWRY